MSSTKNSYPVVPETYPSEFEHRRKLAKGVNTVLAGKMNAVTTLTLTPSVASTTITDSRITPQSYIGFMPQTAHAATELATLYVPSTTQLVGSAVVNHANNAQADRTFTLVIIG